MSLDALRSGAGIDIWHSVVEVNGAPMRLAEAGTGPLVVLLHGFPECWYSWRHQLRALADARFHAVAANQRGYPGTYTPAGVADYTMLHLVSDVVGLNASLDDRVVALESSQARARRPRASGLQTIVPTPSSRQSGIISRSSSRASRL